MCTEHALYGRQNFSDDNEVIAAEESLYASKSCDDVEDMRRVAKIGQSEE